MDALVAYDVNQHTQETLIKMHALMVKRIAQQLLNRLPYSVQLDDLVQVGMIGLLEAIKHYDRSKGASFETYAGIRIRGHMLDEVRRHDWVPRSVYRNTRVINEAVKKVENRLGRSAKDSEVARELDITLDEYGTILKDLTASHLYGFEDVGVTDDIMEEENNWAEPQANVLRQDMSHCLTRIIEGLPRQEKLVLSLYYEQDLNLKEIGDVLEVSESRVSQIHSQAILHIKSRLPATF